MRSFHTLIYSRAAKSLGCGKPLVTKSNSRVSAVRCISITNPKSAPTFRYALEDATIENGCLSVLPESHLTGPLSQRLTNLGNQNLRTWKCRFVLKVVEIEEVGADL